MIRFCFAACALLASAAAALANDSVGHLSAGGIVLGRSDDIEMQSEDLHVSMAEVRVRYRFFNNSDKDITTLVAFPMPDVAAPSDADNRVIPVDTDPVNFMAFKTQIGGKPVDMKVEQRAIAVGIDRTELLKSLNVPLAPYLTAASKATEGLPPEKHEELIALGVARAETYDNTGNGMKRHVLPNWTLRTTYYWTQVFPAKKELIVEHQYRPSVGASVGTIVGTAKPDAAMIEDYRKRYCMDRDFISAAERAQRASKGKENSLVAEKRLEYVLVTGAHWAGPIKDFRMVIDKGAPGNLISACGKFKKISATQFEAREKDYFPTRNLEVLILEPSQP